MSAQITIANWYLDRAARAAGDTSRLYLHYARQAYDIVSQLLPKESPDETVHRVHRDLSVLRERLHDHTKRRRDDLDGRATLSGTRLHDSDLGDSN